MLEKLKDFLGINKYTVRRGDDSIVWYVGHVSKRRALYVANELNHFLTVKTYYVRREYI